MDAPPRNLKRRAERVPVLEMHNLRLELANGQPVTLINISTTGLGLRRPALNSVNEEVAATLIVDAEQFALRLKVVFADQDRVGCQYLLPDRAATKALARALTQLFDAEIAGLRTVKVNAALLKPVARGAPTWFEGEKNCSLYYVSEDGKILNFTLLFFGNCVEGGANQSPRFGAQVVDPSAADAIYQSRTTQRWDLEWPGEMIALARRFLSSVRQLDADVAAQVNSALNAIPLCAPKF